MRTFNYQLADGDRNVGTVYLPEKQAAAVPVLVVCGGGISDRQPGPFTVELCTRLTEAGAGVVTFDFYSTGETGGDPSDWTYGRWAANLTDVCTYVSAQEWADGDRIGALGVSAGSTAVLRCAIDTRKLAAGIAVATYLGHFASMPDGPAKQLIDHLDTLVAGSTVELKGGSSVVYHFGIDFFKDAIGGAPIYRLHNVTCPILFLQGGADNVYRRSDARLGYDLLRSYDLPASYHEIEAGDHVLWNVPREGADAVLAWLRKIGFIS
jgi:dipeptidyl aminopeptidase/acylaminoacyl peptidase